MKHLNGDLVPDHEAVRNSSLWLASRESDQQ